MEEDGAQRRRVLLDENSMEIFNQRMKCDSHDMSVLDDITKNASNLNSQFPELSIYNHQDEHSKFPSQINALDQTFRKQTMNTTQLNPQTEDKFQQKMVASFQQPQKQYFSELSVPLKKLISIGQSYESLPQINADIPTSKNDFIKSLGKREQESSPKGIIIPKSNGTKEDKKTSAHNIDKLQVDLKRDINNMKRKSRKPNQFSLFNRTNLVKKFITTLLSRTQSYLFKNLSQHQVKIIDDKSSNYEYFLSNHMIKDQVKKLYQIKEVQFSWLIRTQSLQR